MPARIQERLNITERYARVPPTRLRLRRKRAVARRITSVMLRRKTGRQNCLRRPLCAYRPQCEGGGRVVSNATRLRLSAPMPLLRGATRTITDSNSNRNSRTTTEPPLRLMPPRERGGGALLLLRPRRRAEEGLQKAV